MLSQRDKKVIWHPYTQMLDAEDPIGITKGEGAGLFDEQGERYIDAISSWWTNLHGHAHPYLSRRIGEQLKKLDHVLFAGFTHEAAVELAEKLLAILPPNQARIFYSDNGSTAVEVALKMALQYAYNKGAPRLKILAFENAYHGDTFGAMSAGGRSVFTRPFNDLLFDVIPLPVPVRGFEQKVFQQFQSVISDHASEISCFIYEPLVQGTAGMIIYDGETLNQILSLCKDNGIITIADEVMTGFGRTGKLFASDYLATKPDIICLSKGITGGVMALGATSCSQEIYDAFLSGDKTKTFFHGHSYTANPVACSAAIASCELLQQQETLDSIRRISRSHQQFTEKNSSLQGIKDIRSLGTILAVELNTTTDSGYFHHLRDRLYHFFIIRKMLVRPLGNVLYIMPPYCITDEELSQLYHAIEEAVREFGLTNS